MGNRDFFKDGEYNTICYVCGRKRKSGEMKKRWDGIYTCMEDWEPRHPQDFVRGALENAIPPYVQPEGTDTFIDISNPIKASTL